MLKALILGILVLSGIVTTPAQGGQVRQFVVGLWAAAAITDDTTKKFAYCIAATTYSDKVVIRLYATAEFFVGISFSHAGWLLTPDKRVKVEYVIDKGQGRAVEGIAWGRTEILVDFNGEVERFRELIQGKELLLAAEGKVFRLDLRDAWKVMRALTDCVRRQLNPATRTAGIMGRGASSISAAERRAEAAVLVSNLLSAAGVTGFRIGSSKEAPEVKADIAWIAGDVIGSLAILPELTATAIHNLKSLLIARDAEQCKGTFFSGSIAEDGEEGVLARIFTSCQSGAKNLTTYYFAVPRKAGGMHVFQTITRAASEKPAKDADENIRRAVFKALPQ